MDVYELGVITMIPGLEAFWTPGVSYLFGSDI